MMKILLSTLIVSCVALAGCQTLGTPSRVSFDNLRKVQIGSSKAQVQEALGQPDDIDFYKRLNEEAWFYTHPVTSEGTIIVSFKSGQTVTAIHVVPFEAIFVGDD